MGMQGLDLAPLEGLTLPQLIDRFPAVPTTVPAAALVPGDVRQRMPQRSASTEAAGTSKILVRNKSTEHFGSEDEDPLSPIVGGDKNYEDLLRRATKGVIGIKDQATLFKYLLHLSPLDLLSLQNKVQEALNLKNPMLKTKGSGVNMMSMVLGEKGPPIVEVSKYSMEFGRQVLAINVEATDKIILTQKSGKVKFSFILPPKDLRYDVRVLPMSGKIKNGKPPKEEIIFGVTCKTTVHAMSVITMELEGGNRHFFTINVKSEPTLFGVQILEHDMVEDSIFKGHSYKVPAILAQLRGCLIRANGLDEDGIFRVGGDENETATMKAKLNKGTFSSSSDVHAIASLIKIWFRELPDPILNDITPEAIMQFGESEEKCMEEFGKLREPHKSLMLWLLDLMVDTAMRESSNKMNARSLSIVVGPNLYHSAESAMLSALESLRLSQQIVSFVFHILANRVRMHQTAKSVRAY